MSKKKTTEQFITEARAIHGGKYDYSKVEYVHSQTKVCIICPVHGEFLQTPKKHLKGQGCPKCAKRYMDGDYFKQVANKVHDARYDYSKIDYQGNQVKVCIICREHGEFWQTPNSHLSGQGCPRCKAKNSKSLVCGVGINDYDDFVKPNQQHLQSYVIWKGMLRRCYLSDEKHPTFKAYKDCSVCEEWKYFSKFKEWFDEHYVEGYELDKDILVQGNKIYSPAACCFVPTEINTLVTSKKGKYKRGVGVSRGRFISRYHTKEGVVHLGVFDSEAEAHEAYKKAKKDHINRVATIFYNEGKITKEVRDALYKWEIKEE